mmetsp:Transcript_20562/g.30481  ORF Transcript_20562/g.30481 Transcript_20562/m.30481 type:complete len:213 (-) Transcript_20562:2618-3256(-)
MSSLIGHRLKPLVLVRRHRIGAMTDCWLPSLTYSSPAVAPVVVEGEVPPDRVEEVAAAEEEAARFLQFRWTPRRLGTFRPRGNQDCPAAHPVSPPWPVLPGVTPMSMRWTGEPGQVLDHSCPHSILRQRRTRARLVVLRALTVSLDVRNPTWSAYSVAKRQSSSLTPKIFGLAWCVEFWGSTALTRRAMLRARGYSKGSRRSTCCRIPSLLL